MEIVNQLEVLPSISSKYSNSYEILGSSTKPPIPLVIKAPELKLKPLPEHLIKYAYLGEHETLPCIIAGDLSFDEESKLLKVLKAHKTAFGWSITDIKGISLTMCMHRILLEEDSKPTREAQRRLNPHMKEVVKVEILKLLDVGIIYPISNSKWVSPMQVVPKKSGMTVVKNEHDELIPTAHLIVYCPYSQEVWKSLLAKLDLEPISCENPFELLESIIFPTEQQKTSLLNLGKILFNAFIWHIWAYRNARIFRSEEHSSTAVLRNIIQTVCSRTHYLDIAFFPK
ncbi:hypothetical protein AAC387_Pa05g1843 [Persea americana]